MKLCPANMNLGDRTSRPVSDHAPLRLNDPDDTACTTGTHASGTSGTTERPVTRVAARDPRSARSLSARDLQALRFIAASGLATQGQVAEAHFTGKSEVVVSRCVKRLRNLELVDVHRWNRIGVNVLKLRSAGRDLLIEQGVPEDTIFMARWPTPGGFAHRLWITDAAIALARVGRFRVQTCWQLRRKLAGTSTPVPDLLAASKDGTRIIAIEIDAASENLKKYVLPRIAELDAALSVWMPGATASIVILTIGAKRAESLRRQLPPTTAEVAVDLLPAAVGRGAVMGIYEVLTRA